MGEQVYFEKGLSGVGSWGVSWEDGIWSGRRWGMRTRIVAVSAAEVRDVRVVPRRPTPERWSRDALQALRATPQAWGVVERQGVVEPQVIPRAVQGGAGVSPCPPKTAWGGGR